MMQVHDWMSTIFFQMQFRLWKKSLNSDHDDQQFHQYQQNKQLSITSYHWT